MTPIISARSVTKRIRHTIAVDHVDLDVARGECVGLVGPKGCGRTTVLRILATLVRPSSGIVEICGIDAVRHVFDVRSRVMFVGSEQVVAGGLRVREHLDFVRSARRVKAEAGDSRSLHRVLERVDLPPDLVVDDLSSDLRQRLALAAAFLVHPDIWLLDNPLRAIDREARSPFLDWLCEARDRGATIVASLDDDRDIERLCHRVARLDRGRSVGHEELVALGIRQTPVAAEVSGST